MPSWYPFAMLLLAGFFVGGSFSFFRAKRMPIALFLGFVGLVCFASAMLTWSPSSG